MADLEVHDRIRGIIHSFLNDDEESFEMIRGLHSEGLNRLIIPIGHFDTVNPEFSKRIINEPFTFIPAIEEAFQQVFLAAAGKKKDSKTSLKPRLGFSSWLGSHTVTPRGLTSRVINKLVCVEGIVTRASITRPKLVRSVHITEVGGKHYVRSHFDTTAL
eukprot:Trichotokara_eunicae@DN417_c0_g1_i1.p1